MANPARPFFFCWHGPVPQGVENVFTQHTPLLFRSLELILKTKTKERDILFPMIENNPRDRCVPIPSRNRALFWDHH